MSAKDSIDAVFGVISVLTPIVTAVLSRNGKLSEAEGQIINTSISSLQTLLSGMTDAQRAEVYAMAQADLDRIRKNAEENLKRHDAFKKFLETQG